MNITILIASAQIKDDGVIETFFKKIYLLMSL